MLLLYLRDELDGIIYTMEVTGRGQTIQCLEDQS